MVPAPGFKEAYQQYVEQGWPSLGCDPEFGGQGMPHFLEVSVMEMLQSANLAFALCPMLGQGALAALESHGTDQLKQAYQQAAAYAKERAQGGQTIINYPDIRRMLMVIRSSVEAMRAIIYITLGIYGGHQWHSGPGPCGPEISSRWS